MNEVLRFELPNGDIVTIPTGGGGGYDDTELRGEVSAIRNDVNLMTSCNVAINNGYIMIDGTIHVQSKNNLEVYTDLIPVCKGDIIRVEYEFGTNYQQWLVVASYDIDGKFLKRTTCQNTSSSHLMGSMVVDSSASYVSVSFNSFGVINDSSCISKLTSISNFPSRAEVTKMINSELSELDTIADDILGVL